MHVWKIARRTLLGRIAVVALGALLALAPSPGRGDPQPYVLDAILSLTGPGAFIGHDAAQSYAALEAWVNATGGIRGRPLKIELHDDQTSPQVAVQLFNAIQARHAPLVLGPTMSATCSAVRPLIQDTVVYCVSPAIHPPPGSYMFSGLTDSHDQFRAIFVYLAQRGLRKVATITLTDATGQDADRGIAEVAQDAKGMEVVDREHFQPGDINVAAQVSRIKASGAQVIVCWSTGTAFGTVLRSLSDAGISLPLVSTSGNMSVVQLKQYAGIMSSELLFPATAVTAGVGTARTRDAIALFDRELARGGVPAPSQVHQIAWDPGMLFVAALRKYGPDLTARKAHDFLADLRGWAGIQGVYDFRTYPQRGLGLDAVIMTRWIPGSERWEAISRGGGVPLAAR